MEYKNKEKKSRIYSVPSPLTRREPGTRTLQLSPGAHPAPSRCAGPGRDRFRHRLGAPAANEADPHPYPYGHAGFATARARTSEAQPLCATAANANESPEHTPAHFPERPSMWEAHCLLGFVGAVTVTHLVTSQRACAKVANQDAAPDDTVQQEVSPDKAVPHEAVVHETAQHLERRADTVSPARTHNASAQTANRPSEQAAGLGLGRSCLFASVESACASPSTEHGGQAVGEGASVCQAADQVQPAPSGFGQRREQGQQEAVDIGKEVAGTCGKDQAADSAEEGSDSGDEAVPVAGTPSTACSFSATSSASPSAPASRASSPTFPEGSKRKRKQPDWYEGFGF